MIRKILCLFMFLCFAANLSAANRVVLQLKWEHEFQFAGYYAAQWQGFYREAGLEVDIRPATRPDGTFIEPMEEMKAGEVQFAVGAMDILIGKDKGVDLLVLAPIFQHSPSAVFSLSSTPLETLSQLAKLRIAAVDNDATKVEMDALFRTRGYDLHKLQYVDAPVTVDSLISGKADAIITYEISAKMQAEENGVTLNKLALTDFGMGFYGDTLYTTRAYAQRHPEVVRKFVAASKKGWEYALENKREIANRISRELPRHVIQYKNITEYNIKFSEIIDTLVDYPDKAIGSLSKDRWFSMNEKIRSLGIVRSHLDSEQFFFDPTKNDDAFSLNTTLLLLSLLFLVLVFVFWYRKNVHLTVVTIMLLSLTAEYQAELILEKEKDQEDRLSLLRQLGSLSAKLEGNLQTNLSMLTGFAAYISAEPELTYDDFRNYARELFKKQPMLINFAAAKDLVVNYVYPLKGNEKVIGLNYRENERQRDMVLQTVNTGQLQVVGPVNLVQGGVAFIGRAPIFTGTGLDRKLWGIISAPLDADLLYLHSGIKELEGSMTFAIRRFDSLGNEGPVFFGNKSIFDDPNRIQFIIGVGGGTWHLAAIPNTSQQQVPLNVLMLRGIALCATLLFCAFVVFRFRQVYKTKILEDTIIKDKKLLEKVGSVANIGGWEVDSAFKVVQWSSQTSLLLGDYPGFFPDKLADIANRFPDDDFSLWRQKIETALKENVAFDIELQTKQKSGTDRWLRVMANPTLDETGQATITGTMQDVTDKVVSAKIIERQATYDSLTDLPNRALFNDRLSKAIERGKRNHGGIAVLFIDLDRFKPVNDNHGHLVGDQLLIEAAKRIRGCVRESDTVSRLSGDEFGVIISDISGHKDALLIIEHIISVMQAAYNLDEISVYCSASVGAAIYPDDAQDADSLIRKADQAMYEVKGSGRNGWHFYTKEMQEQSEYRHALLNQLTDALSNNELMAYYQPIVDLNNGDIVKCESLARWQRADGSFVPPNEFIGLAEESGLVNKIDLYMLENSAREIMDINRDKVARTDTLELSINVSPRLFHTKDRALDNWLVCIEEISKSLDITVEITERLLTHGSDKLLVVLDNLKKMGVKIAIDDFGTGYSSLSYLIKFPVDIIKIDRAFISEIGQESSAEALIETVLIMAKRLGIQVVAEGIETQLQLDFLKKHHCEFGQGYFLGRPMNTNSFVDALNQ